jgi:hypothetical protein
MVAVAFGATTIWLPIMAALFWHVEVNAVWTMSSWTLLPVVLLSSQSVRMPRNAVRWVVASAVALPLILLPAAPGVALATAEWGNLVPARTQIRMLAEKVEAAWHAVTPKALSYVGGNTNLAYGVVAYAHDRPQGLPGLPDQPPAMLIMRGIALVCEASDVACKTKSEQIARRNPASRATDVELMRNYFGISGQPARYRIFVIPPSP